MSKEEGYYEYKVTYYDEFDNKLKTAYGVTFAATYADAVHNIEQYYDCIEKIFIYALMPYHCYEFNAEENSFIIKFEGERDCGNGTGS